MSSGIEHYQEAERILTEAGSHSSQAGRDLAMAAQVHATLALAAATALYGAGSATVTPEYQAWKRTAGSVTP